MNLNTFLTNETNDNVAIVECYSARIGIKWDTEMRSKIEKQRGTTRQWIGRKLHRNVKNECNASVD